MVTNCVGLGLQQSALGVGVHQWSADRAVCTAMHFTVVERWARSLFAALPEAAAMPALAGCEAQGYWWERCTRIVDHDSEEYRHTRAQAATALAESELLAFTASVRAPITDFRSDLQDSWPKACDSRCAMAGQHEKLP